MDSKQFYKTLGNLENIIADLPQKEKEIGEQCMEQFTDLFYQYEYLKGKFYEYTGYVYGD